MRVYNLSMASVEQLVDMPHSIQSTALCPIGVLFRLQVGREYGTQSEGQLSVPERLTLGS